MKKKGSENDNLLNGLSFRSVVDLTAAEKDGKLPSKIQVLPVGRWLTQSYGPLEITPQHLQQIVSNFNAGVRKAVPVDVDHDGGRAAGWIKDMSEDGNFLYADVDWTPYGEEALKNREYRLFSPEWSFDYVDPQYGTHHGAVLVAGSLTNRPLFKELDYMVASEDPKKDLTKGTSIVLLFAKEPMKLEDILKKSKADLSDKEIAFLKDNKSKLSDEQVKKYLATETDEEKAAREKKEADEKAKADEEAKKKEEEAKAAKEKEEADRKAREGKTVTITAQEHAEFLKAQEESKKAAEKLREIKVKEEVQKFIANEKGGKIFPKSQDAVVAFVLKCSEDQKEEFFKILNELPDLKVAGENGDNNNSRLTAAEEIAKKVEDAMKRAREDKKTLTATDAYLQVLKENPELSKKYDEEMKSANK